MRRSRLLQFTNFFLGPSRGCKLYGKIAQKNISDYPIVYTKRPNENLPVQRGPTAVRGVQPGQELLYLRSRRPGEDDGREDDGQARPRRVRSRRDPLHHGGKSPMLTGPEGPRNRVTEVA